MGRDVKVRKQQGVGPANFQRALSRKILKTTKLGTRVCYKEKKHCVSTSHPKGAQDRPCYHVEFHACASLSSSCQPEPEEVQQKSRRKEEVEHRQWESQCVCQSKPSWYWRRAVCGLCVQSFLLPFILVPECRPAPLTLCVCLCVCARASMHACMCVFVWICKCKYRCPWSPDKVAWWLEVGFVSTYPRSWKPNWVLFKNSACL